MTENVKTRVVFCEGAHDVSFISQVFKHCLGFKRNTSLKLAEFPAPFNQLFQASVKHRAVDDLSLDMARKFFLPDQVLCKDRQWVLLFNSGGDSKTDMLKAFLADLLPLIRRANVFAEEAVTAVDYLFTYDADESGVKNRVDKVRKAFATVDGEIFVEGEFEASKSEHGYINKDKAVFVWGEDTQRGTLEDWLIPMYRQKHQDNLNTAFTTLDTMFEWGDGVAKKSKRSKAAITLLGQKKKPGGSMAVVLDQAKLLGSKDFNQAAPVQDFVQFLNEFSAN